MRPEQRRELVRKIAQALSDGKDSGGYDTIHEMYAHMALKVIEEIDEGDAGICNGCGQPIWHEQ